MSWPTTMPMCEQVRPYCVHRRSTTPLKYFSDEGTMFTGALVQVLKEGAKLSTPKFSLQMIQQLTWERIRNTYKESAVRPEVHCPDQKQGDVSRFPLFPNASYRREFLRQEAGFSAEAPESVQLDGTAAVFTHGLSIEDMYALVQSANELAAEIDYSVVLQNILEKAGEFDEVDGRRDPPLQRGRSLRGAARVLLLCSRHRGEGERTSQRLRRAIDLQGSDAQHRRKILQSRMASINHGIEVPAHYKGVDHQTAMLTYSMVCVPLVVAGRRPRRHAGVEHTAGVLQ